MGKLCMIDSFLLIYGGTYISRREQTATWATQYLTLVSGGYDAGFNPQLTGLAHFRELIRVLSGAKEIIRENAAKNGIRLERNVFTRVSVMEDG